MLCKPLAPRRAAEAACIVGYDSRPRPQRQSYQKPRLARPANALSSPDGQHKRLALAGCERVLRCRSAKTSRSGRLAMLNKPDAPADKKEPVVIKKYANRRLYNTETSTYVTLDDLAAMVRGERDFVVFDAKTGDDLTHAVLTQIIVEQESRAGGQTLLPIPFLRQLIRFYGDSIERMVPSYLQVSLENAGQGAGALPQAVRRRLHPGRRLRGLPGAGAQEPRHVRAGDVDVHARSVRQARRGRQSRRGGQAAGGGKRGPSPTRSPSSRRSSPPCSRRSRSCPRTATIAGRSRRVQSATGAQRSERSQPWARSLFCIQSACARWPVDAAADREVAARHADADGEAGDDVDRGRDHDQEEGRRGRQRRPPGTRRCRR